MMIVPLGHANNGPPCSTSDGECQNNSYNKTRDVKWPVYFYVLQQALWYLFESGFLLHLSIS